MGFDRNCCRGTAICCALTKKQLHYFERRQLDSSETPGWRLGEAFLATVVAGGQLDWATVVASGLLNADSQSLHLKALGGDAGQSDDLLTNFGLQSVEQVSGPLRLADRQG